MQTPYKIASTSLQRTIKRLGPEHVHYSEVSFYMMCITSLNKCMDSATLVLYEPDSVCLFPFSILSSTRWRSLQRSSDSNRDTQRSTTMASGRCSPMDSSPCTNQTGSNLMVLAQRNIYINGVARTGIYLTSEFVSISGLLEKIPSVVGRRLCFETRPLYKNIANPITKC